MNKFWNFTQNENGDRVLELGGCICDNGDTWYDDDVCPQAFRDELESAQGNVTVQINSPGGDVFAAAQIYNMLRAYKGKVTVYIDSLAASAASVIAMAGDEVEISPVGMIMIHNPSTLAWGDHNEMERTAATLNEIKESIINAYQAKTHLSREKLSGLMEQETWMNAHTAVEMGFADRIRGEEKTTGGVLFGAKAADRAVMNKIVAKLEGKKPEEIQEPITDSTEDKTEGQAEDNNVLDKGTPLAEINARLNAMKLLM